MKVALAQCNPTVGDFTGNVARILERAEAAAAQGCELVIFPELAVCGYPPADLLDNDSFLQSAERAVCELMDWTAGEARPALLVGTVLPSQVVAGKRVRNAAVVLDEGRRVFVQQKRLLPFYDVFDEQRYFEPGEHQAITTIRGRPVAITICEDAWNDKGFWPERRYTADPVQELMQQWPKQTAHTPFIINISASPFWRGKLQVRETMLGALAKRYGAAVAMANQVGGNDSLIFDGTSLVLSPDGSVSKRAASFAEDLVIFDPDALHADTGLPPSVAPLNGTRDTEEAWHALVLGTRDYVRKCGFSKALVGLSGGIDSALVAAIAVEALGPEHVTGVGMPSGYSSEGSVVDARQLACNLGIRFETLRVHEIFKSFLGTLEPLFAGTESGLAEENLQARIRGALLMALSNKTGALVLTTGNKSEMATGYCTLYGDMVGGLAVIGDVWKTRVYELSRFCNREREVIPETTLTKPPSAELRPGQLDTDSLPPYDVLDPLLKAFVEEYRSADEIAQAQHLDPALVEQVLKLVERSEYKRQQAAPVLKVTQKSFGSGRRFPIAAKTTTSHAADPTNFPSVVEV